MTQHPPHSHPPRSHLRLGAGGVGAHVSLEQGRPLGSPPPSEPASRLLGMSGHLLRKLEGVLGPQDCLPMCSLLLVDS